MTGPEDRFGEFIHQEARGYNEPPAGVPRDAMWTAIAAERRRRAAKHAQQRIQLRWVVGIAAVLVLGVAIGRLTAPAVPAGPAVADHTPAEAGDDMMYRTAAREYFGRAEAVLTMFRADARQGRPDGGASAIARELLSTNRLLLGSPAAADPRMKDLLEDLELVLLQMAQFSVDQGIDPAAFILQALENNSVLLRLRAATPATLAPVSVQGAL